MSGANSSNSGATPPLQQLQQRIIDFEAKVRQKEINGPEEVLLFKSHVSFQYIRKLSLLDTTKKRERNTCMTSPLPRRPMPCKTFPLITLATLFIYGWLRFSCCWVFGQKYKFES